MEKYTVDERIYKNIKTGMNVIDRDEYSSILVAISQLASDTVKKTLGPYAHTTIIDDGTFTYPTKDGWSVLNRLRFSDPIYNTLFKLIKDISFRIVNKVGDGTTTAIVAANHFLKILNKYIEDSHKDTAMIPFRQADLVRGIDIARDLVVEKLKSPKYCHKIDPASDLSDICNIAYISSNGDEELAYAIHDIYSQTKNPNILVQFGNTKDLQYEIRKGYRLDCKFLNYKGYINTDDGYYKNPSNEPMLVAVFNHNVTYTKHMEFISGIINYANASRRLVVIMAPYFDDVMSSVLQSKIEAIFQAHQIPSIFLIQTAMSTTVQKDYVDDFCLLTGARIIDEAKVKAFNVMSHNEKSKPEDRIDDDILEVQEYKLLDSAGQIISSCFGTIKDIAIASSHLTLTDFDRTPMYINTLKELEEKFQKARDKANKDVTNLNNDYMDLYQRYTRLVGTMGVISVGGISELERHCKKDSVDDAVLACRSAFEEGFVAGLNAATLSAIDECSREIIDIAGSEGLNENAAFVAKALSMMFDTFYATSKDVLLNKYPNDDHLWGNTDKISGDVIIGCVAGFNQTGKARAFNIVTETYDTEDHYTVINSVSTDVEIIYAMCSILTLILSSDQFLSINRTYDKREAMNDALETKVSNEVAVWNGIFAALDKYAQDNPNGAIAKIANGIGGNGLSDLFPGIPYDPSFVQPTYEKVYETGDQPPYDDGFTISDTDTDPNIHSV